MPTDITTEVLANEELGNGNFLIEFLADDSWLTMKPAQFFMIGIPGAATLLRRPYSVCGVPGTFTGRRRDAVQVLYKVIGEGTGLLAALKEGAEISVLGPLGQGFTPPAAGVTPVFVAGGIGSAPFPALAASYARSHPAPVMFYGARGRGDLPLRDWFHQHSGELHLATEDGSFGQRGRVTEPLISWLEGRPTESVKLYVCGPDPMLRAVARLATERGLACELALEAHMACGFGVCLGCVVPVQRDDGTIGYDRVCVEGPVMTAERMAW